MIMKNKCNEWNIITLLTISTITINAHSMRQESCQELVDKAAIASLAGTVIPVGIHSFFINHKKNNRVFKSLGRACFPLTIVGIFAYKTNRLLLRYCETMTPFEKDTTSEWKD